MTKTSDWQGIPREQIPWYPTVDLEKCIGCKTCFEFCGHQVYAWDHKTNKAKVVDPYACVVGCSNCRGQCPVEAITFPHLTMLKELKGKKEKAGK